MAACNGNNGVAHCGSNLQIEAIQSVMPMKPTEPRLSRRVLLTVTSQNLGSVGLQGRFHMVLCYNKASEDDSAWMVAGWIKESLGRALIEKPLLAGRLRKLGGKNDVDNGEYEIVSNDSGVRLVEAKMSMDLGDFLDLEDKRNVEAELVYWEDVDELNPQYCPLFYVQVTNFKCGKYSIGISCSLFLADPYAMTSFLSRWSEIHRNMVLEPQMPKIPTFFLPYLRKNGSSPTLSMSSNTRSTNQSNQTLIFKVPTKVLNLSNDDYHVAQKCVEVAEGKIGKKLLSTKLCLFVRETSEDVKVEIFTREGILPNGSINGVIFSSWDELGADNIKFDEKNKAIHFSCWINDNSGNMEDLVLITPTLGEDGSNHMNVIVKIRY